MTVQILLHQSIQNVPENVLGIAAVMMASAVKLERRHALRNARRSVKTVTIHLYRAIQNVPENVSRTAAVMKAYATDMTRRHAL
ncbi:MAG TPA: hypothetical protein PLV84_05795 [Deltaproteobacteria bacterium]|nr:hypothetical protein [Deltaproteobacteria bacterium]